MSSVQKTATKNQHTGLCQVMRAVFFKQLNRIFFPLRLTTVDKSVHIIANSWLKYNAMSVQLMLRNFITEVYNFQRTLLSFLIFQIYKHTQYTQVRGTLTVGLVGAMVLILRS